MIRTGKVCKSCRSKCHELPTEHERLEIECPTCNGGGCDECEDGYVEIKECPKKYCSEVIPALDLIDFFGKGMPPVAGGTLDQTVSFLQAARQLQSDEAYLKGGAINDN